MTLEPHAVKIIQTVSIFDHDFAAKARLQERLAWYYFKHNRWPEAEAMARDACRGCDRAYGLKHKETFRAKGSLAKILQEAGKYGEAEEISQQVLLGTKSILGSKDNATLEAYHFIAKVYQSRGELSLAEKAARKALAGREKGLEAAHPDIYRTQRRLATILELQGKYDAAENLMTTALEGHKVLAGPTDYKTLDIQYRLVFIQRAQGQYATAEKLVREIFAIQSSIYGLDSLETRKMKCSLALSLIAQSKIEEAEPHILDLLQYAKDRHRLDFDHPYVCYLNFALGNVRMAQERYGEAMSLYEMAWKGIERSAPDHHMGLEFHSAHAAAFLKLDPAVNAEEACCTQKDIHEALEKKLGPDHPLTLLSLLRISEALAAKNDIKRASKTAKRVRQRREKVLKSGHPDTLAAAVWAEQLENMKKEKSSGDTSAEVTREGPQKQKAKSAGDETKEDRPKGPFGRWRKSSKSKEHLDVESKEKSQAINAKGDSDSGSDDSTTITDLKTDKEEKPPLVYDEIESKTFAIRRKEVGS